VNRDEQKAITEFIEGAARARAPDMDVEADAIIRALFVRNPDAAYRMTMLAMAQARDLAAQHQTPPPMARKTWLSNVLKRKFVGRPRLDPAAGARRPY
jgi:hypothetical protein